MINISYLRQQRAEKQAARKSLASESKQLTQQIKQASAELKQAVIQHLASLSRFDLSRATRFFNITTADRALSNYQYRAICTGKLGVLIAEHQAESEQLAKLIKSLEDRKPQIIQAAKDQGVLSDLADSSLFQLTKAGERCAL